MTLNQFYQLLIETFRKTIEPTSTISDPIQRQHIRLLNSITFYFIPVTILGGLTHFIIEPGTVPLIYDPSIILIAVPCIFLSLAAICGRFIGYKGAMFLVFLAAYVAIMINALVDPSENFNVSYLILLTALAIMLFDVNPLCLI